MPPPLYPSLPSAPPHSPSGVSVSVVNNGQAPGLRFFLLYFHDSPKELRAVCSVPARVDAVAKLFSVPKEGDCPCSPRGLGSGSQAFCVSAGKPQGETSPRCRVRDLSPEQQALLSQGLSLSLAPGAPCWPQEAGAESCALGPESPHWKAKHRGAGISGSGGHTGFHRAPWLEKTNLATGHVSLREAG